MIISRHELHSLPPLHRAAATADVAEMTRLLGDTPLESRGQTDSGAYQGLAAQRDLTPLMVAAGCDLGSAEAVRTLLARGADPRAVSAAGMDALWYAAGAGDPERVAVLLAAGGRPQAIAGDRRCAVAVAAQAGGAEALRLLLRAGASPHPPAAPEDRDLPSDATPLFAAAAAGSAACVQLLLDAGAQATVRDGEGNTALMFAGGPDVVPPLLAAGCPPDARNTHGQGALDWALGNHRLLMRAAMREDPGCEDRGLLEPVVRGRQAAVVAALLDAGADPNRPDNDGQTALIGYCRLPEVNATLSRLLLARGAQVHTRDRKGQTALHAAAQNRSQPHELNDVIRLLIEAGLPVDVGDNRARTPLHWAAAKERGNRRAIPVLLQLGADVEARDGDGLTPLMLAAGIEDNSFPVVRLLLDHGANPGARAPDGRPARDLAALRVAELQEPIVTPDPAPETPARAIGLAAWRRLALRSAGATLEALGGPATSAPSADTPPGLPEPIWLGYRLRQRRLPLPASPQETSHIEEVCNYAHACWTADENHAACFASLGSAPEEFRRDEDGRPLEAHAYRALPLLFDASGAVNRLSAEELLGPGAPPPQAPALTRFRRLGYDVTECTSRSGPWTGCSPLSPYCNGLYLDLCTLVNRYCLIDDLARAYDLAIHFGVGQPEPGPYIIVEAWRALDS
jgi:ankyrin repeat protein